MVAEETTDVPVEAIQAAERGGWAGVNLSGVASFNVRDVKGTYVFAVNLCVVIPRLGLKKQDHAMITFSLTAHV